MIYRISAKGILEKNNSILFVNLNPGKYELRVKAKSQQGVMSEEHVIKFTIKPHFLKSKLYFYALTPD